ncbi:MAG: hypothetical protein SFY80_13040 [Verrucomicrobiota bacterium]|nr:hypothetical protein [Verrucomicrobiota bacterium]
MKELLSRPQVSLLVTSFLLSTMVGCSTFREEKPIAVNFTENSWAAPAIPEGVRRVVVLPVAVTLPSENLAATTLWQERATTALNGELAKTNRFEVIHSSPASLSAWSGRNAPRISGTLPADFLKAVQTAEGADAVILAELMLARDYPPFAASWKVRLVSVRDGSMIWASDYYFDGQDKGTQQAAQLYSGEKMVSAKGVAPYPAIFQSSQGFLRFSLAMLFPTLPLHAKPPSAVQAELSPHKNSNAVDLAAYPKPNHP